MPNWYVVCSIKSERRGNKCERLTASPTVPSPNTATLDPGSTLAVFQTAPRPGVGDDVGRERCE